MLQLILSLAGFAATACNETPLAGRWQSEKPEAIRAAAGDVNYIVRTFEFSGDRWTIEFTLFDDAEATVPLLAGRNEGRYRLGPHSSQAEEAREAEFAFFNRTLTPKSSGMASALTRAGCGERPWEVGVAQSVIEGGCEAFRVYPRAKCDREFDLVRLDGDRMALGQRPADGFLCTPDRRPIATGAPLVRSD